MIIKTATQSLALAACLAGSILHADESAPALTKANPPEWVKKGAYVYRISTPDRANILPEAEEGFKLTSNLLDQSIVQIPIMNGLLGHDHEGPWNWDGLWPFWDRVTFRAGNWKSLTEFMDWSAKNANTRVSFHVNCTDVNKGLVDYPESREFLKKLIETKSIYRRTQIDPKTNQRIGDPEVPVNFAEEMKSPAWDGKPRETIEINALVNYKNFYDSGLFKSMVDSLYSHFPNPPPVLYLDVLNQGGGNFSTGFPDGPLGGSEQTQIEGMQNFAEYLHSKGTDVGTEGFRPFMGVDAKGVQRAGYAWLHAGMSDDDYSRIAGCNDSALERLHVYGNPGGFNLSPIALSPEEITKTKEHYAALLAGKPGVESVAPLSQFHIAIREGNTHDQYDIPGTGDQFRGGWHDLVNNFYMHAIQELYHIGNGAVRTRYETEGQIHVGTYTLKSPGGDITVLFADFLTNWTKAGAVQMRETGLYENIETKVTVPKAGDYPMSFTYRGMKARHATVQIYVNGAVQGLYKDLKTEGDGDGAWSTVDCGAIHLNEGENTIAIDTGESRATWTDGTEAVWTTPFLRKGFKVTNGDVTLAIDYDRMWPDTWSGQKKIYFFSWDGTNRSWKLPTEWRSKKSVTVYPLTPEGRGKGEKLTVSDGSVSPKLLPQIPYILTE